MMTAWLHLQLVPEELDLIEYFAGKARVTKMALRRGWNARAVDVEYTRGNIRRPKWGSCMQPRGSMDINGEAGFVLLDLMS